MPVPISSRCRVAGRDARAASISSRICSTDPKKSAPSMRSMSSCGQSGVSPRRRRKRRCCAGSGATRTTFGCVARLGDRRAAKRAHRSENRHLQPDRQRRDERDGKCQRIGAARSPQATHRTDVDEAHRDDEEHAGHRRHRKEARQWAHQRRGSRAEEYSREHAGERRARPGLVVRTGAVERTGRRIARCEGADDVGETLADEFLVAVDALSGSQRDGARARDRLGQPDQRHCQSDRRERLPRAQRHLGHRERRHGRRQCTDRRHLRDAEARQPVGEHLRRATRCR